MATIPYEVKPYDHASVRVTWEGMGDDDVGEWFDRAGVWPDKSVHVYGTHAGATTILQGSNETYVYINPVTLKNLSHVDLSTPIDLTDDVAENVCALRPRTFGGAGTNVNVAVLMRK